MNTIQLRELAKYVNTDIKLNGWLHGKRGNNKIQFLQVRNSGRIIQVVAEKQKIGEENFAIIKSLNQETSLVIQGKLVESEKAEIGYEVQLESFQKIGDSQDYPITPKEHGVDFLHDHRHLWLRSKKQLPILSVRNELSFQIRKYFYENGYTLIDTPILTGSIGESAGNLFSTEYFDEGNAYLAQTGQLYLESAIFAHNQVYCFGPTFRAEKSKTRRHLTEFWMCEAETAFLDNEANLELQEDFVRKIGVNTIKSLDEQLKTLERDAEKALYYLEKPFTKIEYKEAIELLNSNGYNTDWGHDINAEKEEFLTKHFDGFVFIKNYPESIKAFYMKQNPKDENTVLCADLIAPEGVGEIIGGSEREESYDVLVAKLEKEGLPIDSYLWYLDLRKYGSIPHSGFGLGLERFIAYICGLPHVRECIPFPRLMERLYP